MTDNPWPSRFCDDLADRLEPLLYGTVADTRGRAKADAIIRSTINDFLAHHLIPAETFVTSTEDAAQRWWLFTISFRDCTSPIYVRIRF